MGIGFGGSRQVFRFSRSPRAEMQQPSGFGCLLMVIVPLLLLVSAYLAWWELRFFVQGRTTDATVDGVQKMLMSRHRWLGGSYLEVHYTFTDEPTGLPRSEYDELPLSWPRPAGTVLVQYISGVPGGSRLQGHRHPIFTLFFVVSVGAAVVGAGLLLREARRAVREEEAFEAKRRRSPGKWMN
jgi:hypothetical protein